MKIGSNLSFSWAAGVSVLALLQFTMIGCDQESTSSSQVPQSASNFVSAGDEGQIEMPHTIDTATEFPAALASISIGSQKPELRGSEVGHTVVRVEKAPAIAKSGQPMAKNQLEQDWDGTVLIPSGTQMSHARSDNVDFGRIEAHPLADGSLRVWVRVKNVTHTDLITRMACNFQSASNERIKTSFATTTIPADDAVDVYFMSPMPNVVSYTILVR
ncbi:hypothetical protein [Cerasicoccus maritimus]|uniref:hypothetical protein n=1 Tax=Cerasicoccus maritimus TaxID=490089 RepID=UPI002852BD21|nr:hypothetical protein [Cerasicoccus maritimus]